VFKNSSKSSNRCYFA